ncbi:Spy/CpxP family protein refolding chaperone [Rubrivivax gelatinosus]|uniref:Spy/CpxP family protein refolding chaperone n=1 Tax=Rubrivivax gelatinosus TaxID=28068 RepID=UPI0005C1BB8C|nr:Spy/CpxP family protein refolding chaperone [Rubrivivax gelatinosus]MBG6078791.1 Spy/CpxP family protein refolding chaperone [Rubrivivax gelatinosus]
MKLTNRLPFPPSFRSLATAAMLAATSLAAVAADAPTAPPPPPAHAMPAHPGMPMGGPAAGRPDAMPWLGHPYMLPRLLDDVDASKAQRKQIREIVGDAQDDLLEQRDEHRRLAEQMAELFAQPSVDAKAVEALRQKMLAEHDKSSRRMTQAMLDVSRVLTPEQRQKIAAEMKSRREALDTRRGPGDHPRR